MNATTSKSTSAPVSAEVKAATALDTKLRKAATKADSAFGDLSVLVAQAKANGIHKLLGFPTWAAYVADVASTNMPLMHASARVPLVKMLNAEGMSQRAIAQIASVTQAQVSRDLSGRKGVTQAKRPLSARVTAMLAQVREQIATFEVDELHALRVELSATGDAVTSEIDRKLSASVQRHPAGRRKTAATEAEQRAAHGQQQLAV